MIIRTRPLNKFQEKILRDPHLNLPPGAVSPLVSRLRSRAEGKPLGDRQPGFEDVSLKRAQTKFKQWPMEKQVLSWDPFWANSLRNTQRLLDEEVMRNPCKDVYAESQIGKGVQFDVVDGTGKGKGKDHGKSKANNTIDVIAEDMAESATEESKYQTSRG